MFRTRENSFEIDLDHLFDIADADVLEKMKIEYDNYF